MPNPKLVINNIGLEAQFRLIPKDDEKEEGQIEDDDEEDSDISSDNNRDTNAAEDNSSKAEKHPRISLFEMQSFLIALILPEPRLSTPPTWCRVIRCMQAHNVGIFLLDDQELDWIEDKASKFTYAFRFESAPNWIETLLSVPLSRRLQNTTTPENNYHCSGGRFESDLNAAHKVPKTALLLSPLQMIVENYPMPTEEHIRVLRSKYNPVNDSSPMFAMDCEMCITDRSELTKISIVDEELRIVYNELVKPENPITNYLTRYSGITKAMMENVTTTISDVHHFMRKNLPRDSILCGHSLNMDLSAVQIFHPYVIDTSVIYNRTGRRNYKPSLKSLAYEFLGKEIQTVDKIGHDSLEDAITTMELVKLKLVNGPLFADSVSIETSQGIKYDSKTGITHLQIDKFIERHNTTPLSYRFIDTTPKARCIYVHDRQEPLEDDVKDAILQLLERKLSICVVLTSTGECYVKF